MTKKPEVKRLLREQIAAKTQQLFNAAGGISGMFIKPVRQVEENSQNEHDESKAKRAD